MFHLVQTFYPLTSFVFIRSIVSLNERLNQSRFGIDDLCQHLIFPKSYQSKEKYLREYFSNDFQFHYVNSDTEMYDIINKIKPDAILLSTYCHHQFVDPLLKNLTCQPKLFFVPHGFARPNKSHNYSHFSSQVYYFIPDNVLEKFLIKDIGLSTSNYSKIHGLPQIDFLITHQFEFLDKQQLQQKYPIIKDKTVFLIACGVNSPYTHSTKPMIETMTLIKKIFPQSFIFFKAKGPHHPISKILKTSWQNNFQMIDPHDILYHYFSADIHIIMEGGTTWLESLLINPYKTILYQNYNPDVDYDYSFDQTSYQQLMVSKNNQQLQFYLEKIKSGDQFSSEYDQAIKDMHQSYLGYDSLQSVSETILKTIMN